MIRLLCIFSTTVFLFCSSAYCQSSFEYGKTAELKGLTRIYIDTGADVKSRDLFIKEFEKSKLTELVAVDSPDEAEIFISFTGGSTPAVVGSGGNINTVQKNTGIGYIAVKGHDPTKLRIIMNADYMQRSTFFDKPAEKFAKNFVKEYKQANGMK